jgi:hypothetical protein
MMGIYDLCSTLSKGFCGSQGLSSGCVHLILLVARLLAEDYITKWRFTIGWELLV